MALDIDDCKEMLSKIVEEIDYDLWKEMEDEDNQDCQLNYDSLVKIVKYYVKVNP